MGRLRGPALLRPPSRALPAAVAAGLLAVGLLATAVRLDSPGDGSTLPFGSATWGTGSVVVHVPEASAGGLRPGDEVTAIGGTRLADRLGGLPEPSPGDVLRYDLADGASRAVTVAPPAVGPLLDEGWGDLVFVVALGALA